MCQKMFLNTLGISERAVEIALDNGGNNIIADDKQGKHAPNHKIGETTLCHSILPSHLPPEINAVEMYNDYLLDCAEKNCKPYSYTGY